MPLNMNPDQRRFPTGYTKEEYQSQLDLGFRVHMNGSWETAVTYYSEILTAQNALDEDGHARKGKTLEQERFWTEVLLDQALNFRMLNQFPEAKNSLWRAYELTRDPSKFDQEFLVTAAYLDLFRVQGNTIQLNQQQNYANSLLNKRWFTEYDLDQSYPAAKLYQNLGLVARGDHNLAKAMDYYTQAHGILTNLRLGDQENIRLQDAIARNLHLIGVITEEASGPFSEVNAIRYQKSAYTMYEQLRHCRGLGNTATALGNIYKFLGETDNAREWLQKAQTAATSDNGKIIDQVIFTEAQTLLDQLQ